VIIFTSHNKPPKVTYFQQFPSKVGAIFSQLFLVAKYRRK
jgi:hypothetical protein